MTQHQPHSSTRRDLIRLATAAGAALGVPAIAVADPIYEAIERHRGLWAELGRQCRATREMDALEQNAALAPLHDDIEGAENELIESKITTIAGAVALLRYVAEMEREEDKPFHELIDPEALADALAQIGEVRS
jgi:hypothetical protein